MINLISGIEAQELHTQISNTADRIEIYPDIFQHKCWIDRILNFIDSRDKKFSFGIEDNFGEMNFFSSEKEDIYPILFISKIIPIELVIFGYDWMIGISSYPEEDGVKKLEYSIRLYGKSRIITREE